jgi:hypothetical protein
MYTEAHLLIIISQLLEKVCLYPKEISMYYAKMTLQKNKLRKNGKNKIASILFISKVSGFDGKWIQSQ